MRHLIVIVVILQMHALAAQDLPMREIPAYPENYSEGTILARFTEGLGFRYYWATEGLTEKDLAYKPSVDARTSRETMEHLYGLSRFIYDTVHGDAIRSSAEYKEFEFDQLRAETLALLEKSSETLRNTPFQPHDITFAPNAAGEVTTLPYWHLINGPISDALYHTGQIVSFRRASGNPIPSGVSVFMGTKN